MPIRNEEEERYTFMTRWCGCEKPSGALCGRMFNLCFGRRSGQFINASTYLTPWAKHQEVVEACPDCGWPLDENWLLHVLTAPLPEQVQGRD